MRLDALLPLHPAWADVRQLDALIAHAEHLPVAPTQAAVPVGAAVIPPPLSAGDANLVTATPNSAQILRPAMERVQKLQTMFEARTVRVLRRERQAAEAELDADVDHYRADVISHLPDEEQRLRKDFDKRTRDLRFKEIAYLSQVAALRDAPPSEPVRIEVQNKLAAVRKQLADEEALLTRELAALRTSVAQRVADYREQRENDLDRKLQTREQQLKNDARQAVVRIEQSIPTQVPALTQIRVPSVPPGPVARTQPLPSPAEVASAVRASAVVTTEQSAQKPVAAALQERSRLVDYIRDDIKRRLDRAAAENHWRLSFAPKLGVPDITEQAASVLRGDWKP